MTKSWDAEPMTVPNEYELTGVPLSRTVTTSCSSDDSAIGEQPTKNTHTTAATHTLIDTTTISPAEPAARDQLHRRASVAPDFGWLHDPQHGHPVVSLRQRKEHAVRGRIDGHRVSVRA